MTHITVGDISPRIQYLADGTQTVFTYPFPIFKAADMAVYLGNALQIRGVTIAGAGQSRGGTVTFSTAPAQGVVVTLRRKLKIARTTDFQQSGAFRAKVLNDELDYQTAAIQQVNEALSRTLRRAFTSTSNVALILPEPKADTLLGWNTRADALENKAQKVTGVTAKTLAEGTPASASYNDATGLITLGIPIGATGDTGMPGVKGDQGATGPQGPTGATGATGPQGVRGGTGPRGLQGLKGDTGATGPVGATGAMGPAGTNGVFSAIATKAEAEAGTDTVKGMTPLRVKQAIAALSPAPPPGVPVGTVIASASTTTPAGYLHCNGGAISRRAYAPLHRAIGTRFGAGNGSTTFNIPDFRGTFLRGWDNGRGLDSGRLFGSYQADDFKAHTHRIRKRGSTGSWNQAGVTEGDAADRYFSYPATETVGGAETRPKNVAVNFYIKY